MGGQYHGTAINVRWIIHTPRHMDVVSWMLTPADALCEDVETNLRILNLFNLACKHTYIR